MGIYLSFSVSTQVEADLHTAKMGVTMVTEAQEQGLSTSEKRSPVLSNFVGRALKGLGNSSSREISCRFSFVHCDLPELVHFKHTHTHTIQYYCQMDEATQH